MGSFGTAEGAEAALRGLLGQRIVVLDGAWGTMFQGTGLTPADYRGCIRPKLNRGYNY